MISAKQVSTLIIAGVVGLVIVVSVFFITSQSQILTLRIGDGVFKARVAKTDAAREKGLGDTTTLADNEAMILAFATDDQWQIWMKGMRYPLDIVWLDKDKAVVYIVKNAPYEEGELARYKPTALARYVVELPAGTVDKKRISIGKHASFDLATETIRE